MTPGWRKHNTSIDQWQQLQLPQLQLCRQQLQRRRRRRRRRQWLRRGCGGDTYISSSGGDGDGGEAAAAAAVEGSRVGEWRVCGSGACAGVVCVCAVRERRVCLSTESTARGRGQGEIFPLMMLRLIFQSVSVFFIFSAKQKAGGGALVSGRCTESRSFISSTNFRHTAASFYVEVPCPHPRPILPLIEPCPM